MTLTVLQNSLLLFNQKANFFHSRSLTTFLYLFLLISAADSFDYKTFFIKGGLNSKSKDELTKIFSILDQDRSGFIEEEELKLFQKNFYTSARALTDAETKALLAAGDSGGDGITGVDEFQPLVKS